MKLMGIALVILGAIALVVGGIGYNRQTTIFDVGGFRATTAEHKTPAITPVAGGLALAAGFLFLISPLSRRT